MIIPPSLNTLLSKHVTLEIESIDRMYLNLYVPRLQRDVGVAAFFKKHRQALFASSVLMDKITKAFVAQIEDYTKKQQIPLISFVRGQRKDDLAKSALKEFTEQEGVLFVGKAQEKTPVFRTQKRTHPETGRTYPWIVKSTAMVNAYYFYGVDEDFGPFFLKYASYFPYNAKLCINGHEYLKRQLAKEGIAYEALDNGLFSCADPVRAQQIADDLTPEKIADLAHKWQQRLPFPFTQEDTEAGYAYQVSILQAEFSLTQVLECGQAGRLLFEEIIRENLDLGRPSQVQLIFDRKIIATTPGRFRTRVITEGVTPSLHVDYKSSRIKQYHKEGQALRTETTINNTRDFGIGKNILNLPLLRKVGFAANRRLLAVERVSHDCLVSQTTLEQVERPLTTPEGQRTSALRFADAKVQAVFSALVLLSMVAQGFSNRDLRAPLAAFLGVSEEEISAGQMTYQLRRLRLHGMIVRVPKSHRYLLSAEGLRLALFYTRAYARLLRPGLGLVSGAPHLPSSEASSCFEELEQAMNRCCQAVYLAA
jgi:hypothetical protein